MTTNTLLDLIARIEAATGPDRGLDAEIHFVLHARPYPVGGETWGQVARDFDILRFTKSVDAALKLIPPSGWLQHLGHNLAGYTCRVELQDVSEASTGRPTPALALCAAALKARSKE